MNIWEQEKNMKQKKIMYCLAISAVVSLSACCADTDVREQAINSIPRGWAHGYGYADLQAPQAEQLNLEQLNDVYQIKDRFYRWGIAYDEGRLEVIKALFTENADYKVFNASLGPEEGVVAHWRGLDSILENVPKIMSRQADQRRHFMSNVIIDELSDDAAVAYAYGNVVLPERQLIVGASVFYSAELKKVKGVWLFDRLVIGMDSYAR